jgi:hypothetical protein
MEEVDGSNPSRSTIIQNSSSFPPNADPTATEAPPRDLHNMQSVSRFRSAMVPFKPLSMILICTALIPAAAAPVAVRHTEGLVHGFLVMSSMDGSPLAQGDLIQVAANNQVINHLVFRFKDGSVRDETAVYSQHGTFRLLSYRLTQKGPAFEQRSEMSFDTSKGEVTVRYTDDGKDKVATDRMELPLDVANGLIFTLLKNLGPDGPPTTVSMVAATPKPRLVKLQISPEGEEPFSVAGSKRMAMHYVLKVEIGGVAGLIAPLLGKKPPDVHVWILGGEAPAFVKSEGPLYYGGPSWRIELASPVWPRPSLSGRTDRK